MLGDPQNISKLLSQPLGSPKDHLSEFNDDCRDIMMLQVCKGAHLDPGERFLRLAGYIWPPFTLQVSTAFMAFGHL